MYQYISVCTGFLSTFFSPLYFFRHVKKNLSEENDRKQNDKVISSFCVNTYKARHDSVACVAIIS